MSRRCIPAHDNSGTASGQNTDPDNISVQFRVQIGQNGVPKPPITIQCNLNDKVSKVVQYYRNKTGDNDAAHQKLIYNAKRLNETLTLAEAGIINNSTIFIINDEGLVGGS